MFKVWDTVFANKFLYKTRDEYISYYRASKRKIESIVKEERLFLWRKIESTYYNCTPDWLMYCYSTKFSFVYKDEESYNIALSDYLFDWDVNIDKIKTYYKRITIWTIITPIIILLAIYWLYSLIIN